MRAINHALTGAAIGLLVAEPLIALPLAFASHFVCDAIPHFGGGLPEPQEINSKVFRRLLPVDTALCLLFVLLLALYKPEHWVLAAVCAFAAASPDLLSIKRYLDVRRGKHHHAGPYGRFAAKIQWFERPIGAVVEIAWFIALLLILVPFFKS